MATITPVKITESGITSSLSTCAAAGDDFTNTGVEFVRIQNYHATATYSIKIEVQTTSYKHPQYGVLTKSNIYKTIAPPGNSQSTEANVGATSAIFGPFKQASFNDANNKVKIYYKTGTGADETAWNALGTTLAGTHLLKIEVLYLDN